MIIRLNQSTYNIYYLFQVWVSELQRTHQTANGIKTVNSRKVRTELNELGSGLFDDLTYAEFEEYPAGESYIDVCARLAPVLAELDRSHHLMVISHQAVLRCVFGFLLRRPAEEIPYIKVPLHTIITVTYTNGENIVRFHKIDVACVDTYKPKAKENEAEEENSSVKIMADRERVEFAQMKHGNRRLVTQIVQQQSCIASTIS
jgi:broad specificity phosphatase PhoE